MQMQSGEKPLWRCAETVTRRAKRDTMRSEVDYCEKAARRAWLTKREEEICSSAKPKSPERAETRESFELERAVSCRGHDHRWRTELDFGSGESFNARVRKFIIHDRYWARPSNCSLARKANFTATASIILKADLFFVSGVKVPSNED